MHSFSACFIPERSDPLLLNAASGVRSHACRLCSRKLPMLRQHIAMHVHKSHHTQMKSGRYFELFYSDMKNEHKTSQPWNFKQRVQRERLRHLPLLTVKCPWCPRQFGGLAILRKHVEIHGKGKAIEACIQSVSLV